MKPTVKNAVSLFAVIAVTVSVPAFSKDATVDFDNGVNVKTVLAGIKANNDSFQIPAVPLQQAAKPTQEMHSAQLADNTNVKVLPDSVLSQYMLALTTTDPSSKRDVLNLLSNANDAVKTNYLNSHLNGQVLMREPAEPWLILPNGNVGKLSLGTNISRGMCIKSHTETRCGNKTVCKYVCVAAGAAAGYVAGTVTTGGIAGGAAASAGVAVAGQVCQDVCENVQDCAPVQICDDEAPFPD